MYCKANILVLGALLGTGCLGSGDLSTGTGDPAPGDGTASGAAQSFAQAQSAVSKCSGSGCHEGVAPKFLGNPGRDDDYTTIKQHVIDVLANFDGNTAKIVTYGQNGVHKGVTYSANETTAVKAWLDAEKKTSTGGAPPNPGGGAVPVAQTGLAGWAACLTQADINTPAQGATVAFDDIVNKNSNQGQCAACHEDGNNGQLMATDDGVMLALMKGTPYAWARTDEQGKVVAVMEKWEHMGDGLQQQANRPGTLHPNYNNDAGNEFTVALTAMVNQVAQRQATGACAGGTPQGWY
jgi:hypothetical protein